jgi:hypothetical protein
MRYITSIERRAKGEGRKEGFAEGYLQGFAEGFLQGMRLGGFLTSGRAAGHFSCDGTTVQRGANDRTACAGSGKWIALRCARIHTRTVGVYPVLPVLDETTKSLRLGVLQGIKCILEREFGPEGLTVLPRIKKFRSIPRLQRLLDTIPHARSIDQTKKSLR